MPLTPAPLNADFTQGPGGRGGPGNALNPQWRAWMDGLNRTMINVGAGGVSTKRPTANLYRGLVFFDDTLNKPIFVKTVGPPAVWVDATGAIV